MKNLDEDYTFRPKQKKNLLAGHLWQQIVHRIVWGLIWKIALVDCPLLQVRFSHLRFFRILKIILKNAE
jgi:hypothetical protein